MAVALIGILCILPYVLTIQGPLLRRMQNQLPPLGLLLVLQVLQALVLVALATALGLWLGPKLGLGAPLLRDLVAGSPDARARLRAILLPSVALGVLVAVVIVALDVLVFGPRLPAGGDLAGAGQPPAWQGLLASFYGGIVEELLLRLGLMTVLVWAGTRLARAATPGPTVMWGAIVLAAVLFGAGHLPVTAAILPLTPLVIARALVLNGLGGLVFGWLYWRRGILAAMLAHFSADLVLHAVVPMLHG